LSIVCIWLQPNKIVKSRHEMIRVVYALI
jgi:hypothetical protein